MSGAIHSHRDVDCGLGAGSCGHYRLPLLPAVGDNAAMEAEPPKAEPPKRKRRWFQFSLRTLMIVVTLLAIPGGYVGWQAKIVRDRNAMLEAGRDGPVVDSTLDNGKDGADPHNTPLA